MQILSFLGVGKVLTRLVALIYRTIASLYTGMIEVATTFNSSDLSVFLNSLVENIYVLVGVFMLFRVGISLLNYLVDPGKLDDKKVGGGQLIMHILISVILLVSLRTLIIPVTNSIQNLLVCGDAKCEEKEGGILYKLIPDEYKYSLDNEIANDIAESIVYKTTQNVTNVYAETTKLDDSTTKLACYYSLKSQNSSSGDKEVGYKKINIEIDFYKTKSSSYGNSIKLKYYTNGILGIGRSKEDAVDNNNYYYFVSSNDSEFLSIYKSIGDITFNDKSGMNSISSGVCPNILSIFGVLIYGNNDYVLGLTNGSSTKEGNKNDTVNSAAKHDEWYYPDEIANDVESAKGGYGGTLDSRGTEFSINLLKPFVAPSDELTEDFLINRGDEDDIGSTSYWASRIEDEEISSKDNKTTYSMDWLMAIIAGVAVAVVLIALCIEVVVRNLKLLFLQAVAPIAIISYMNPNDKVLSNWIKQYIGTFLSLFLYIIVIQVVPPMMKAMLNSINSNLIMTLVVIGGSLLFMKEAPKFLSKLFGLDNMSGSFGDTFKMVKTGLGIGAGAAAGAVAGTVTGFGAGGSASTIMGGLLGGTFRGASGGAKGKAFDGVKTQIGRNQKVRDMNLNGSTWGQRMLSKVGLDKSSRSKSDLSELQAYQKKYKDFTQHKKNIEDLADSSDFMTNLRNERNADGSQKYTSEQLKAARTDWINAQQNIANGKIPSNIIVGNSRYGVVEEKGKWSGIETELKVAEAERNNSGLLKELSSGGNPIKDFSSLDAIDKDVKKANNDVTVKIAEIVSDPTYIAAEASKNSK